MAKHSKMALIWAVGLAAIAGSASARGVAGSPQTTHNIVPNVNGWPGWSVTQAGAPMPISYSTLGDLWNATLRGSNGNPLPGSIQEGRTYALDFTIIPTGDPDWFGWQSLLPDGWQWVTGSSVYANPTITVDTLSTPDEEAVPLPGISYVVLNTSSPGANLVFSFPRLDPVSPATVSLRIRTFVRWIGVNPAVPDNFPGGEVNVLSQPLIPSPTTAGVLALLGLAANRRRRDAQESSKYGLD